MSAILLMSILIRLLAMGWSIVLVKQNKDWRMAFLTAMLGFMALRQILTLWDVFDTWSLSFTMHITELPGLIVSVMTLLVVYSLNRMLVGLSSTASELQKSVENQKEIVNFLPQIILEADLQGNTVFANQAGYSAFGEITNNLDVVVPEDRERASANIKLASQGETIGPNEYTLLRKDGSTFPAIIYSSPIMNEDKVSGIRSLIVDITERKQIEEALRSTTKNLQEAQRLTHLGFWNLDIHKNELFWSEELYSIFALDKDTFELSRDNVLEMVDREDQERVEKTFSKSLREKTPLSIVFRINLANRKQRYIHALGETREDENGESIHIFGTLQDITERRQTEDTIIDFSRIFNNSLNEIYLFDATTLNFVMVNKAARDNLGYTWQELQALTPIDIKPEITPEIFAEMIAPLFKGERAEIEFETVHERKDKSLYNVEVHLQLLRHDLEPMFAAIILDITARKQSEMELQNSELKYRTLVESSPYCIHQIDLNGMIISMNRAGLDMLAIKDEEAIVGTSYLGAVNDLHREYISGLMDSAFAGESSEFEFLGSNGLELRSNFVPIFDNEGKVDRLLGITQNISESKLAEAALKESESKFRSIFEQAAIGVALVDAKSQQVIRINQFYCDMLGYSQEEMSNVDSFRKITHPDDLKEDLEKTEGLANKGNFEFSMDKRYIHKNGGIVWVHLTLSSIEDLSNNSTQYFLGIVQDITDRKQSEDELRKLSRGVEASSSGVIITDDDGVIEYVNPKFTEITQYSREEAIGQHVSLIRSTETPQGTFDELWKTVKAGSDWKGELHDRRKDGSLFWNRVSITELKDAQGEITHFITNHEDVTHEYELAEQLSYQASHDALTGLVNRREFERRTERLLSTIRQNQSEHALCYMDLDQFKVVNDTCGHTAGDEMMQQLSAVLQKAVRKRDTLARLGGDEFGVLIEHCSSEHAHRVASTLQKVIQDYQFVWEGHVFRVGVSIGLVAITETFSNLTELLKQADAACYMAKDLGRNRIHVYRGDDASLAQRHGEMQWVTRINLALELNRFCLYAQTIVSLDASENKHYELLVRMEDEDGKLIPPGAFLPAAERYNLIEHIDTWVIENALTLLAMNPVFL
ncbi:MAG: diguanylate cyclase (GGDEF)-like protein/PAS domain S-box-containing protein, partial [Gammaproteobacteria bacterium]